MPYNLEAALEVTIGTLVETQPNNSTITGSENL
jgi:hypothetical protein